MLNRRFPVTFLKGTLGLCLAVLLVAPVALLWSAGKTQPAGTRGGLEKLSSAPGNSEGAPYSQAGIQTELDFMAKSKRAYYERNEWWPAENGPRHFGNVDVTAVRSPNTLFLPNGKGSFNTKGGRPEIGAALKKDPGVARPNGDYFIVQINEQAVKGKKNEDVRQMIASLGDVAVFDYLPNNAYVIRAKGQARQALRSSSVFQFVDDFQPAYKINPGVGIRPSLSPTRAAEDKLLLTVRTFPGEPTADLKADITKRFQGEVISDQTLGDGQHVLSITLDKQRVAQLAHREEISSIDEQAEFVKTALVTSIDTEMGRLLDPRIEGKFVRPFYEEGIDGGGTYDPNKVGCGTPTPFNPNTGTVDPTCYSVEPQFVGLVDNGITLDAAPLANNRTQPCTGPTTDCSALATGSGVGSSHRKVEVYVRSRDKNHDGVIDDAGADGDFLSCDAISSGGDTHGQIVAATMLGAPSGSQFGLGFFFSDADNSNQFAGYFNDTNEKNLPLDGQAPGARLLFIDAQGNGTPVAGPPPCATNLRSDVNPGAAVVDDVEALVYRRDLNLANNTMNARGAEIVVLPFGQGNFDNNIFNDHNTYAGNASDIDNFLFTNRRVLTVVPVGNDGADPNNGAHRDPFVPTDPNDVFDANDIQVNNLASGKNILSVGSNNTDTLQRSIAATDETEIGNRFSSKGPATFASLRMAPLVMANGSEPTKGGGGREGEYTDDFFSSHAVIVSFDDDQSNAGAGIELVRNQRKIGTSFSAGKVGGAGAQVRDYFAKGYYPTGIRGGSAARNDLSGALVKAIITGSADYLQTDLIGNCSTKFCIQQGYGKVELANILPLKSYSKTRRPADSSNLANQPDVPSNILVADELWDGGAGFGVVALGQSKNFNFYVVHGGATLRASLAWYDAPGETLVNNLNLEIDDGDYDNTTLQGAAGNAKGYCGGGLGPNVPVPSVCGNCQHGDAYFDPNGVNPYFRRYLGNKFGDRSQFSLYAQCDPNAPTQLLLSDANSQPDAANTTEQVFLSSTGDTNVVTGGANGFVNVLQNQGASSSGFFRARVSFPDNPAVVEKGAPNTPCIVCAAAGCPGQAVGASDAIVTSRDGISFVVSGVDNTGTAGVDEARCDSTAAVGNTQLIPNGQIGQPFGLVVTGPIAYGSAKTSQVELNKSSYDCSDTALTVQVTENTTSPAIPSSTTIGSRTTIQVLDPAGAVKDTEAGITFTPGTTLFGASTFRLWRAMTAVSESKRVQYIGGLSRTPIASNGLVEVTEGDTIRAVYADSDLGDTTVTASAKVVCKPLIGEAYVNPGLENFTQRIIGGGCDAGRFIGNRGDIGLDAKEAVQYQLFFTNHSGEQINNLTATLSCEDPVPGGVNPCDPNAAAHITIVDPVQHLGRIPFGREFGAAWTIKMTEPVRTLTGANAVVLLNVAFSASNTDFGNQLATQTYQFREALQADNQILYYDTDRPSGGAAFVDYNENGQIDKAEFGNGGRREGREIRTYQTWTGTTNAGLLTACGGQSCIPFNFDRNNGGFATAGPGPNGLSGDSKPGAGYPTATQGWFYGTGGACGWQTQGVGPGFAKGVWHAGQGPIGAFGAGCGSYIVPSDSATSPFVEFTTWLLRSPTFNKVNTGTDARGFNFDLRIENLAWNSSEELVDTRATILVEIDTNIDDDGPVILGDTYSYREPFGPARPLTNSVNGARRFGPKFDPDNSITASNTATGDEVGISTPLAAYDAGNFLQRPLLPYPAVDSDGNAGNGFTSDERISTGANCGSVPVGQPCRLSGFTTAAGPVRARDVDTGGTFEDFNGKSGNRFAFEMAWGLNEGGTSATGWTIDDARFEWSEQHPVDQAAFVGGDCSLNNLGGLACTANSCVGGVRNGLFCSNVNDCVDVITEGTCVSSKCTTGRVGNACSVNNDCDLGRCVAGNTALGCSVDADCNLATNDCDAIQFRPSPVSAVGSSGVARPCANIKYENLFTYDCTSGLDIVLTDETPQLCTAASDVNGDGVLDGCSASPRQVLVNARSGEEPLGEPTKLTETSNGSGIFMGTVDISSINDQKGVLFLDSDPGEGVNLVVSYADPECDADQDGIVGESNFQDLDGDGVKNFGANNVLKDQHPTKTYFTGGPISDDDNCYDSLLVLDTFNPAGQAQMDLNNDGLINGTDCVVDPNHNGSGQCDFDSDGIGDICDNCPKTANADQLDTDSDGIGNVCEDNDIDKDLVSNSNDNCPTVYNPSQSFSGGGGKGGGSRFNRGILCDDGSDKDFDGVVERVDNCPNELLVENGSGGFLPGPCPGGATTCTYNPDQRDTDADGVGDICDSEDFDRDGVINSVDDCVTVYNPADAAFAFQTDSDGDGLGDDRSGTDNIGTCQAGSPAGQIQCLPVGTQANCGSPGGFCVQSASSYCDPDSTDDGNNGVPDDLVQFATQIDCNYSPGGLGSPTIEVGAFSLSAVTIADDGTADPVCTTGDPNPNNDPATIEQCPSRANSACDTPGAPGSGTCSNVPDGIVDAGELANVRLTLANQSVDLALAPKTVPNTIVGIRTDSPTIGCVPKGQVFQGTVAGNAVFQTAAGALQFIVSTVTGQSVPTQIAEAEFLVTVQGDGVEANTPEQKFKVSLDQDVQFFPPIASGCGVGTTALGAAHSAPGVLCEDFDTFRNATAGFQWTRLYPSASTDPLAGNIDPNDDVIGHSVDGGPVPFGVDGRICSDDNGFAAARVDCHVVPTENDWHIHSQNEGCDPTYGNAGGFATSCAPEARAHSGFRSMHMGRHLNATDTNFDTYRFRQTSAFVLDPVNLGVASTLEFWHIIQVCDDKCVNAGAGGTTAGGQVQVSLLNPANGLYDRWQRLTATQNGYNSIDQGVIVICEFDPGDDQNPPNNETMCGGAPQWSDIGDIYGSDRSCTVDQDNNDPVDRDCGSTTNRTVVGGCSWVTDPTCGSFLETGSQGRGVWAKSTFNLSAFSGRKARLRWIFEGGGGWSFGQSRSWLEPQPGGVPSNIFDQDDGWYIDDIKLTDLRTSPATVAADPTDGLASCLAQGDTNNCGAVTVNIATATPDFRSGSLDVGVAQSGGSILLDARTTVATPSGCLNGVLEYQWSALNRVTGLPSGIIQGYSPDGTIIVNPLSDSVYQVDARCSSDTACAGSAIIDVLAYTGDGDDIMTRLGGGGTNVLAFGANIVVANGLSIDHDSTTNIATLSWKGRPQPAGVSGWDVFKVTTTGDTGTDIFPANQFGIGGGSTCFANAVANGANGASLTRTDAAMPAAGSASLYMLAHSSNNALAKAPLGKRPGDAPGLGNNVPCPTCNAMSNRANVRILSRDTCP